MRMLAMVLTVLLIAGIAFAGMNTETVTDFRGPNPANLANVLFAFWDMTDVTGWTTADLTATAVPHFHISSYLPFDGTDHWWCGSFAYDADGGYGNSWDDRLIIPPTDVTGATYPVLTFAHYFDSEIAYDFTYVQCKQGGAFVDLNAGYDGSSGGWVDIGMYGFVITGFDNPIEARFRFLSDGAWSDEDGLYLSVGGAYHVDNIKIFDFYGGAVYFYDDVNSGSPCVAGVPGAAGDYWHLVDDVCSSNVIPSWWCGDDADTSLIPGGLSNALMTPPVDISLAETCTLRMAIHAEVPTIDNDYWNNAVSFDGGASWISLGSWWGDFEGCDGFGTAGLDGEVLTPMLPASTVMYRVTLNTTDNGCGPGLAGGAGINLDDTWFEGELIEVPVEESSWGSIKAMYR